jgi:hypothetical protein
VWGLIVLAACVLGFHAWGRTEAVAASHAPGTETVVEAGAPPQERE